MYFRDLSPYSFLVIPGGLIKPLVNVGWLDEHHEFPTGTVSKGFLKKLKMLVCCFSQNSTMGFHTSPFVNKPSSQHYNVGCNVAITYREEQILLGSAEIHVEGPSKVYVAPDLIYHYVSDCQYLPPEEFIEAVSNLQVGKHEGNVADH